MHSNRDVPYLGSHTSVNMRTDNKSYCSPVFMMDNMSVFKIVYCLICFGADSQRLLAFHNNFLLSVSGNSSSDRLNTPFVVTLNTHISVP